MHVPTRHGAGRRAGNDRQPLDAEAVGGDRPPGLGLPSVIDHRHPELLLCPAQGLGVATLACEEERAATGEVVAADVTALRVLLPDRPKGGRRGEERADLVLRDHSPEGAASGVPTGLPS